jgi:pimeloyl-ACP methyl ester carboxylesterase
VLARPRVVRAAARASAIPGLRRVAYEIVNAEYIQRHVMLGSPRDAPLCVFRSFAGMNRAVYAAMWGPSEYCPTGVLRDWDVSERLREIAVPTLVTSGRHDEATPRQMRALRDGILNAHWVLFEHSAHAALIEESARYRAVLEEFLRASEEVSNGGEVVAAERGQAPQEQPTALPTVGPADAVGRAR